MTNAYDVIIVGARCAGSPTAMLLARKGYRVLLVDRATFPSDTLSSHVIQPTGVGALQRWGLFDRLAATGCPPIHTFAFDFGPFTISGAPGTEPAPAAFCARRTVLDKLLVDAAVEAGVELREAFTVEDLVIDGGGVTGIRGHSRGGGTVTERAPVVVGADGWHSVVAARVQTERYHEKPPLLAAYYSYWSDLPVGGTFEIYSRPYRAFGAAATHDGLTMIIGGWPYAEFAANRADVAGAFGRMLDLVPEFAERVRGARRVARFSGATLPNYFRKPYGRGWVLVGDAGYIKDSLTAQGISDAFLDAERCATALDVALAGRRSFEEAMREYQHQRDEHARPMYDLTCQLATLEPPPQEMQTLLGVLRGKREAMNSFVQMNAGTISPAQFFAPDNLGRLLGDTVAVS